MFKVKRNKKENPRGINDLKQLALILVAKNMDFGCGFWVKEWFHSVPQKPESRSSVDDEHSVQSLHKETKKFETFQMSITKLTHMF